MMKLLSNTDSLGLRDLQLILRPCAEQFFALNCASLALARLFQHVQLELFTVNILLCSDIIFFIVLDTAQEGLPLKMFSC